jgi:hypothetical protein
MDTERRDELMQTISLRGGERLLQVPAGVLVTETKSARDVAMAILGTEVPAYVAPVLADNLITALETEGYLVAPR